MHELQELLGEVFAIHGFTVTPSAALEGRSGTVYTAPLLVEKGGVAMVVDGRLEEVIDRRVVQEFQQVQQDTGASLGILCHLRRAEPDAHNAESVVLWGPDRLARIIGEARLCHVVQAELPELPLLPFVSMSEDLEEMLVQGGGEMTVATAAAEPEMVSIPGLDEPQEDEMSFLDDALEEDIPVAEAAPPFEPAMAGEPLLARDEIDVTLADQLPLPDAGLDILDIQESPLAGMLDQLLPDKSPSMDALLGEPEPTAIPAAALPLDAASEHFDAMEYAAAESLHIPEAFDDALDLDKLDALDEEIGWSLGAHPLLPVRISQDDARRLSEARLFHIERTKLVLQPVYLFDYECDVLSEGSLKYDTVRGRLQVHGTDKRVIEVDPALVDARTASLVTSLDDIEHEERALRLSEEGALTIARTAVLERHTRMVEVEVGDLESSFSYTEKRKVVPRPDHVRLNDLGVHLRPVWRLVGTNGSLDLDGVDGTLEDQMLRRSDPDVMIIE